MAIASAMDPPRSVNALNATANPSGRLCSVIVAAMIRPSRISPPCWLRSASSSDALLPLPPSAKLTAADACCCSCSARAPSGIPAAACDAAAAEAMSVLPPAGSSDAAWRGLPAAGIVPPEPANSLTSCDVDGCLAPTVGHLTPVAAVASGTAVQSSVHGRAACSSAHNQACTSQPGVPSSPLTHSHARLHIQLYDGMRANLRAPSAARCRNAHAHVRRQLLPPPAAAAAANCKAAHECCLQARTCCCCSSASSGLLARLMWLSGGLGSSGSSSANTNAPAATAAVIPRKLLPLPTALCHHSSRPDTVAITPMAEQQVRGRALVGGSSSCSGCCCCCDSAHLSLRGRPAWLRLGCS